MKNKFLLFLLLVTTHCITAQTVGTTSTNPIVVSAGTTILTNQNPDSIQKYYLISPTKENVLIKSKLITQSNINSFILA